VRIDHAIWTTTGLIVFVAVSTQTNLLKNLINKVKNPPHGFYFAGPSFGSNESHCYQDNQEVPCGYFDDVCGYFDPVTQLQEEQLQSQQQPNFTQPLVSPDINKDIESQQPKKHKKHHKTHPSTHTPTTDIDANIVPIHAIPALNYPEDTSTVQPPSQSLIPSPPPSSLPQPPNDQQVNAQVECPDDPNTMPCGSNCYHDGRLYETVCSASPPYPIPTGPGPSQNNIHPTTPDQNQEDQYSQYNPYAPSHAQTKPGGGGVRQQRQQLITGTPSYIISLGIGGTPYPVTWNPYTKSGPCKVGNLHEHLTRDTCRLQTNLENLYNQDYAIVGTANIPSFATGSTHHGGNCKEDGTGEGSCSPRLEITSGGPGSSGDSCCGFTMSVNNFDGTMHMEQEGPGSQAGDYYCSDSNNEHYPACTQKGASVTGGAPIYGKQIDIAWVKCGNRYGGVIRGPNGRVPTAGVAWSPRIGNVGIITQCPEGKCNDSTRIRVDSVGLSSPYASDPVVYTNPCQTGGGYSYY
jgi:hypothetical protein